MDVTKRDQVEALAMDHDRVDVLFNVAGYFSPLSSACIYSYCQCLALIIRPHTCVNLVEKDYDENNPQRTFFYRQLKNKIKRQL